MAPGRRMQEEEERRPRRSREEKRIEPVVIISDGIAQQPSISNHLFLWFQIKSVRAKSRLCDTITQT